MIFSLRTADVSPRSSPLKDVTGDERGETSAIRWLYDFINVLVGIKTPEITVYILNPIFAKNVNNFEIKSNDRYFP